MMKFSRSTAAALFCGVLLALPTFAKEKVLDEAVAIVDDDVVLRSELTMRLRTVKQDLEARNAKLPDEVALRKQVLDRLISDSIQLQMAYRAGVRVGDTELTQVLERIAQQNGVTLEQFRQRVEQEGNNFELFREDIRNNMMTSRIRQGQVSRRIFISDQEVQNMVDAINAEGAEHTEYHLGHILIPIAESASTEQVQDASNNAQNIVDKLRKGADFGETAIGVSAGQEALQGGDFGWKSLAQLPTLFATAVKTMKVAQISEPLRSASGLHILKVFDSRGNETVIVNQTHARHVLIKPSAILNDADALKKARDLLARVRGGEEFAAVAKKYSDDPGSANLGGDLGWANPGMFVKEFETVMGTLQPGEISEPFKSQFGWHFLQVIERRDDDQTDEMKKQQAYKILHDRKYDEEVEAWLREIREQAYVKLIEKDKKKAS